MDIERTLYDVITAPNFDATTLYPIPNPSATTGPNPPKTIVSVDKVEVESTKWLKYSWFFDVNNPESH